MKEDEEVKMGGDEEEEAQRLRVLRNPGTPTQAEVEVHNLTHLPYRSWCPACVAGKARDRGHEASVTDYSEGVPQIVMDYCFMKGDEDEDTVAIQVAKDRRTRMVFAHVIPRKGLASKHGANELLKDIEKLGYKEIILKGDNEPAIRSVQEEVKKRREEPTLLENSPVGDSRSNGAAERAVQSVGEQIRVLRKALESRMGYRLPGSHPALAWMVEHAADLLSKFLVGIDGKTAYERLKGKKYDQELAEFGEKVHYRLDKKSISNKLEAKWAEGFFLGILWRSGEAIIGTDEGVVKAGTIKRVGGDRRWDGEGFKKVRGFPWQWSSEEAPEEVRVRYLTDEEIVGLAIGAEEGSVRVNRVRLNKEDFVKHGFTQGCLGCAALIAGTPARGHSEACRARMEAAFAMSPEGLERKRKQEEKENEWLAAKLRMSDEASKVQKSAEVATSGTGGSSGSGLTTEDRKRGLESDIRLGLEESAKLAKIKETNMQVEAQRGEKRKGDEADDRDRDRDLSVQTDSYHISSMEVFCVENKLQDDFKWELNQVSDMCDPEAPMTQVMDYNNSYYDENTGEILDPNLVKESEQEEMNRFKKMKVYTYVTRREAEQDPRGVLVKVKWVRINKGTRIRQKVRCRLVAQEIRRGRKDDELFAGTPSLTAVKVILAKMASRRKEGMELMVLDVKCAFLYGKIVRPVYIELPGQDPMSLDPFVVGKLEKAMYGTRDAPQIWQGEVRKVMKKLGFEVSLREPSLYHHKERDMDVVAHVDDFLCTGRDKDLTWFHQKLRAEFDITATRLGPQNDKEVKFLNRTLRWCKKGLEIEGDTKHSEILIQEWGMRTCKTMDTPMSKDVAERLSLGEVLGEIEAVKVRGSIARINYMSLDRIDLSVVSRMLCQRMSAPTRGTEIGLKRVIRYLRGHPRGWCLMKWDCGLHLKAITDSDWAGDHEQRKSISGGGIFVGESLVAHWSKMQSNIALSSGEAELNAAVKGISELIGVMELLRELEVEVNEPTLETDASACKGMLLRRGAGRVKHLSTKQLWVQGAIEAHAIQVHQVPREVNVADIWTHVVNRADLIKFLQRTCFETGPLPPDGKIPSGGGGVQDD